MKEQQETDLLLSVKNIEKYLKELAEPEPKMEVQLPKTQTKFEQLPDFQKPAKIHSFIELNMPHVRLVQLIEGISQDRLNEKLDPLIEKLDSLLNSIVSHGEK